MSEALNDWNLSPDPETLDYHTRQREPYRSTVAFGEFIEPWARNSDWILDIGCGIGHATNYLAGIYRNTGFTGLDISEHLIGLAASSFNIPFLHGDVCNLQAGWNIEGVTSIQMLSWMPGYEVPLSEIAQKIKPRWIAASSLFWEGNISTRTIVTEYDRPRKSFYNVYSLPKIREFMDGQGYTLAEYKRFEIDCDLPEPEDKNTMKSHTVGQLILSGPVYLPWGFVAFERKE